MLFPHKPPPWWAPKKQLSGPHVVKSGEWMSYPGIYLCSPDDGLLYSPGTWAPYRYNEDPEDKTPIPTEWTLIWLDDRYQNGAPVPEEEALYFPPDLEEGGCKKVEFARAMPGEPCPRSGMWYANYLDDPARYFREGEIMPGPKSNNMGAIIWYWLQDEHTAEP